MNLMVYFHLIQYIQNRTATCSQYFTCHCLDPSRYFSHAESLKSSVYFILVAHLSLGQLLCDLAAAAYSGATAYANYADTPTNVTEGTFYKQGSPAKYAVCVKSKTAASGDTWATMVSGGYLIPINFMEEVPVPEDTSTGETFIKALKGAVEVAQDISEGNSLNGNTIGAEVGLALYVKQGVMPSLEVDTMAGAFHLEKLSAGVEAKVIKDFGSTSSKAYAILLDPRGIRLHVDYEAVRNNTNGFGDFENLFHHLELTGFISRNCFFKIFIDD